MKIRICSVLVLSAVLTALGAQAPAAKLTLAQLEQVALAHNPTLRQAADAVSAAQGRAQQAGLWPNPTVGYEGAQIRGGDFRGGEQGAFVQQDILLGHKLQAAHQAAAAVATEQQAAASAQRQAVRTAVQLAYYNALETQQEVALRQQLASIAADAARTTRQLGNVGQADRPDQLQAQVEAEQAGLDLTQAQQRQRAAWTQLAATVGQPSLPPTALAGDLATLPPAVDAPSYLTRLLTDSPAVQVAEAGVTAAKARLRSTRKQPIPNLQVKAGLEANRELDPITRRPPGWQGFAEVGVQVPLFNRNQGNVKAGVADLDRAQQELERVRLALRERAAAPLAEYATAAAAVAQYRSQMLPQAKQAYDMYMANYHNMAAAYPQVLVAQRTWFQLQTAYVAALGRLWSSATMLQGFLLTQGLGATGGVQ